MRRAASLHVEVSRAFERPGFRAGPIVDALGDTLAAGYPPGLAFAVVDADGPLLTVFGGAACVVGEDAPMMRGTLFDLASLTKVVATVPLALLLAQRGLWRLDDSVSAWIRGFPRTETTLRNLLTHTSGLIPHRPYYLDRAGRRLIQRAVLEDAVDAQPKGDVCYSDLNFMLLGWALARCARLPLDRLFRREIAGPLGMHETRFLPGLAARRRTAAAELDGDQRTTSGLVWGDVHDGNAFALGGVAGHAGLFAPLDDLARFVAALLRRPHPVLSDASIASMTTRQAGSQPDVRGLGWRLDPTDWGPWPEGTYWHTGFTGTSLLVSPGRGLAVVLLMNGVHPVRRPDEQQAIRARIHTIVAEVSA